MLLRSLKAGRNSKTKYSAISSDESADPEHGPDLEMVAYSDDPAAPQPQVRMPAVLSIAGALCSAKTSIIVQS